MPWVRFDDQFSIHRKVAGLSDAAFRLHVSAIFWCARNLTDGFLPEEDLDDVCARVRTPGRFAAECVRRGAWHHARESCESEKCPAPVDADGWVIHDYLEYQFSKERVLRDREKSNERQSNWRNRKRNAVSNASSNGVTNGYPAPTRPEGSGSGGARPGRGGSRASPPGPPATAKPPWCGLCDEHTRLYGDPPRRCPDCHPLRPAADVIDITERKTAQEGGYP